MTLAERKEQGDHFLTLPRLRGFEIAPSACPQLRAGLSRPFRDLGPAAVTWVGLLWAPFDR